MLCPTGRMHGLFRFYSHTLPTNCRCRICGTRIAKHGERPRRLVVSRRPVLRRMIFGSSGQSNYSVSCGLPAGLAPWHTRRSGLASYPSEVCAKLLRQCLPVSRTGLQPVRRRWLQLYRCRRQWILRFGWHPRNRRLPTRRSALEALCPARVRCSDTRGESHRHSSKDRSRNGRRSLHELRLPHAGSGKVNGDGGSCRSAHALRVIVSYGRDVVGQADRIIDASGQ